MDAAGIISNLLEDPFYVLHEFSLFIEYGKYGSSLGNSGSIELTFGGPDSPPLIHQQQRAELPEIIEHMLKDAMRQYDQTAQEKWEDQTVQETQEESMDRSDTSQKPESAETASTEWTASSVDSDGLLTPEGAFDKLYAAVLLRKDMPTNVPIMQKEIFMQFSVNGKRKTASRSCTSEKLRFMIGFRPMASQFIVCYNEYTTRTAVMEYGN